jgi:hypothetical protein
VLPLGEMLAFTTILVALTHPTEAPYISVDKCPYKFGGRVSRSMSESRYLWPPKWVLLRFLQR